MNQGLIKSWWLLALCGVLEGVVGIENLLMRDPGGSVILRRFAAEGIVVFQGEIALAAGCCMIAVGFWQSMKGKSWLLALNGLGLIAYGLISVFWSRGRLAFLPVALLFVLMAMSFGIFALATALTQARRVDRWLFGVGGMGSLVYALAFFALGVRWIEMHGPGSYFLWSSSFFGFSAICMLGLALLLYSLRTTHRMVSWTFPSG